MGNKAVSREEGKEAPASVVASMSEFANLCTGSALCQGPGRTFGAYFRALTRNEASTKPNQQAVRKASPEREAGQLHPQMYALRNLATTTTTS